MITFSRESRFRRVVVENNTKVNSALAFVMTANLCNDSLVIAVKETFCQNIYNTSAQIPLELTYVYMMYLS